jgi:hypothetical protein
MAPGWAGCCCPHVQAVEVWPASGSPQRLDAADVLDAGPEIPGLQLHLAGIWSG